MKYLVIIDQGEYLAASKSMLKIMTDVRKDDLFIIAAECSSMKQAKQRAGALNMSVDLHNNKQTTKEI